MAIKTIRTHNIQSHADVLIQLPETGLVVFTGDNSNGKSVIGKVLKDIVSYAISNVRVRKSDINHKCNEGQVELTRYDGVKLLVNLNIEASMTWARLTRADGTELTRYLSDKTIPDLVREFGFHYDTNREISLNLCDSDDSVLFFRTSHVTNGDIVNSALTDMEAQARYELLDTQYKQALATKQTYQNSLMVAQAARSALQLCDVEKETEKLQKYKRLRDVMSTFYQPQLREIQPVPDAKFITLPSVTLRDLYLPKYAYLPAVTQRDLAKTQTLINSLQKGECPTCHRPFCSCQTSTSAT